MLWRRHSFLHPGRSGDWEQYLNLHCWKNLHTEKIDHTSEKQITEHFAEQCVNKSKLIWHSTNRRQNCPLPALSTMKMAFYFILFFFRTIPMAYGGSQAGSLIGATAANLCCSHSNARSEQHLRPTPQLMAMLNPQPSKARDWTCNLMVPSWIRFHWAKMGTPQNGFFDLEIYLGVQ